jgi:DNA repair protein SbcC/Rad50
MIPVIITLNNFLSYGNTDVAIDFSDYSMICLSGKNGNGKSALLDAITWALWGQARKISGVAKADSGLLRLGQSRMVVSLEFFSGQQKYRVRREFAKMHGHPYLALDFEIFEESNFSYVALTDKTVKLTQEKIESVVGLDFETFVNSAFLRQGQANEFSKKGAKERKEILANILGLSWYDGLQRLALEKHREFDEKGRVLLKINEKESAGLFDTKELLQVQKEKVSELESLNRSI